MKKVSEDIVPGPPFTRDSAESRAIRFSVRRKNGKTGKNEKEKGKKRSVAKVISPFLPLPFPPPSKGLIYREH